MSNNDRNESYMNLVNEKIEHDKLLYNLPKSKQVLIEKLIEKRDEIRKSNKIFAEYQINKINKKIQKIKNSN